MLLIDILYWFLQAFLLACTIRALSFFLSKKKGDKLDNVHTFLVEHMKVFTSPCEKAFELYLPNMAYLSFLATAVLMAVLINTAIMVISSILIF